MYFVLIIFFCIKVRGSPFAADKRRGFRLWRQRARRRTNKSEGSANENGTNDENPEGNGEEGKVSGKKKNYGMIYEKNNERNNIIYYNVQFNLLLHIFN